MNEWAYEAWVDQDVIHPAGLAATVVCCILILVVPRRWVFIPLLCAACLIPPGQRIVIAGLDFTVLRIVVLAGLGRIIVRGEYRGVRPVAMDGLVAAGASVTTVASVLLHGTTAALVNRLGYSLDTVGTYLLFRALVRGWEDLASLVRTFAAMAIVVCGFLGVEYSSGRNLFSALGGVPELTVVREGRMRCQGAFAHPILAGAYWAAVLPLLVGAFGLVRNQVLLSAAVVATFGIVVFSGSSTPVSAVIVVLVGFACWPMRRHLALFRLAAAIAAVFLHFAMERGIAHLLARIDFTGGSTGWHRYHLITAAVERLEEWWLIGTKSTSHWGLGLFDITNQYVLDGVTGGLLATLILIGQIVLGFRIVGRLMRSTAASRRTQFAAYSVGVALLVHAVVFISVSYFGQIVALWMLQLAILASLGERVGVGQVAAKGDADTFGAIDARRPSSRTKPVSDPALGRAREATWATARRGD